ncbi:MAG: hypothetical protein J6V31_00770 [Tidjanibacter sp.]|nr:hypothetical protein [Tidjanibacter sp.]
MHDINIMRTFLQQQTAGVFLFRVPIAEIRIATVTDKVPAPAALDFADHA